MMDKNDIDNALHEIKQMVLVALDATQDMLRSDAEPDIYCLSEASGERLAFAVGDILDRVERLRAGLPESTDALFGACPDRQRR